MSVIKLEVDDNLIKAVGQQTVKAFMKRQLSLLRVQYLGEKIAVAIHHSGIDHKKEVEEARQEAWQEYRAKRSTDI